MLHFSIMKLDYNPNPLGSFLITLVLSNIVFCLTAQSPLSPRNISTYVTILYIYNYDIKYIINIKYNKVDRCLARYSPRAEANNAMPCNTVRYNTIPCNTTRLIFIGEKGTFFF